MSGPDFKQMGYDDAKSGSMNSGRYADQSEVGRAYRDGIRQWNREAADLKEAAAASAPAEPPPAPAAEPAPAPAAAPASNEPETKAAEPEGFSLFGKDLFGDDIRPEGRGPLAEKFIIPPFTILNAREGEWQDRKRAWLACGIESEVGRGGNLLNMSDTMLCPDPAKRALAKTFNAAGLIKEGPGAAAARMAATPGGGRDNETTVYEGGTSIFDPVLCELAYRWWCGPGGQIIDPFAGGSVRGIIASLVGRRYWGGDLRKEQIEANRVQGAAICPPENQPVWVIGDSRETMVGAPDADLIFSCPPYGDLEVYSDDPKDLSTLDYPDFRPAYFQIIKAACDRLKPNRFAAFVVGDFRDDKGIYRNFVSDTIAAFIAAGLDYYNEAILVTSVGTAALRANRQFSGSRKLVKCHQNLLVFVKGDSKKAALACGEL